MEAKEMIEYLKQDDLKVIFESQVESKIRHTCNNTKIYFYYDGGTYDSFGNEVNPEHGGYNSTLLDMLSRIIRIEKTIDSKEYFPIWTKEDGEITQSDKFVKLNGRYYTIKFLEQLIDKISEFKKINI
jgi:hypothetical protein